MKVDRYRGVDMRPGAVLGRFYGKLLEGKFQAVQSINYILSPKKTPCILYGLQRAGTNYVEHVVRSNFPGTRIQNAKQRSHYRHKHWRLYSDKTLIPTAQFKSEQSAGDAKTLWNLYQNEGIDIAAVVVVVREPLHWYRSYQSWAKRAEWPAAKYHYLQEWNAFYGAWHALAAEDPQRIMLVRYEDFLGSGDQVFADLARVLQLPRVGATQALDQVPHSQHFDDAKRAANLSPLTLDDFSANDRQAILANLDPSLIEALGYADYSGIGA